MTSGARSRFAGSSTTDPKAASAIMAVDTTTDAKRKAELLRELHATDAPARNAALWPILSEPLAFLGEAFIVTPKERGVLVHQDRLPRF
jgi:hypothetical protein